MRLDVGWSIDAAKRDSALSTARRSWGLSPLGRSSTSTSPAYLLLAQATFKATVKSCISAAHAWPSFCRGLASAPTHCDRPSATVRHREGVLALPTVKLIVQRLN